jgi:hypothetical protein
MRNGAKGTRCERRRLTLSREVTLVAKLAIEVGRPDGHERIIALVLVFDLIAS